jgi:histidine decarboxylase
MLSRRRFLGYSIAGAFTAVAGCRPPDLDLQNRQPTNGGQFGNLLDAKAHLANRKHLFLGYPVNMNTPPDDFFTWRREIQNVGIDHFAFNNVGNPFAESTIPFNTHDLEREIILRFGKIYGFPDENTRGFLSHSGTDSNMHGMYIGRTLLYGRTGVNPKCYFTKEAHYSIQVLTDLLGMEAIFVDTIPDASMDTDDLRAKLKHNANVPALIVATVGTTFKGAIDPVEDIRNLLSDHEHYLHLDAALFAGYLPHTEGADLVRHQQSPHSSYGRFDSIAVSCHKFFGFPSPAGLFITTGTIFDHFQEYYSRVHNPEYIGHVPGTITCSRDAVKPAEFFYFSTREAMERQAHDARKVLDHADYLLQQMKSHFPSLQPVRSGTFSNTIFFRKPMNDIVKKYSLATMHMSGAGQPEEYAHVVIMPHVSRKVLDEFLSDLQKSASSDMDLAHSAKSF